ncbi:chondroitin synthase [Culex quinquefasciatus]|uniref:Hexosyltransferase n=1 Tax=Culex quinquefasciatus TaxID=7176 RepID=B0XF21_CULQU|nr:chondroitin synthase [Culex quinquefasciatus]|eukprot:XP_001868243.1 chondroitin synthase [Culex quinquefasciatus]
MLRLLNQIENGVYRECRLEATGVSRHDIIPWTHLNLTHVRPLSSVDAEDIQNILNKTILVAPRNNPQLKHFGLHSVYRNFDAVRGMNYRMHLSFYDRGRLEHVFNSIEVVKPMVKRIEIAPSVYVTPSKGDEDDQKCFHSSVAFNHCKRYAYTVPYLLLGPSGMGKTATLIVGIEQISIFKPNSKILAMPTSNAAANEFIV